MKQLLILGVSFLMGVISTLYLKSDNVADENSSASLSIPIFKNCDVDVNSFNFPPILNVGFSKFNMNIDGANLEGFLRVHYAGPADDVLTYFYRRLDGCFPNINTRYDSDLILSDELKTLFDKSYERNIYMTIKDGSAVVSFVE